MSDPVVALVLHDVAPQTWADYQPFVEAVDAMGAIPITWLVVPDFHHGGSLAGADQLRNMLDSRVARGDELVLHGYFHADDMPAPRTPRDWFMRRVYTWEGEFYKLSETQALNRLERGLEVFERYQWPVRGFVAPAWLMSEGTRLALRQLPLSYTSDQQHLYRLPDFSAIDAPGLVWSAGSAWRRGVSKVVCDLRERQWQNAPLIRLGLHPVDMRHGFSRDYWLETLKRLIDSGRRPVTKSAWLDSLSAPKGSSPA